MPLGVLPNLRPFTTVQTAPGPLTLPSRPWSVLVVDQAVAAAFTVLLPATPPKNTIVQVKDGKGDAATNAITIDGNGQQIDGAATTSISTDYGAVYLGYDGSEWRQLANVGSGGGGGGSGNSSITITQANVALALGQAVYFDAIQGWIPAIANSASTLGLAIVTAQLSPTTYTIYFSGDVTNLPNPYPIEQGGIAVPDPLEAGEYYYVSASIAGSLTKNEPATYSNPLLFGLSATEAVVLPFRPSVVSSPFPGPSTDLLDATGNAVVVGTGLTLSGGTLTATGGGGGGPAPAIDANDRYVYACDDLSGPIANTGTGPLGALTVSGSPRYESGRLTRSAPSILFPADAATDGADSGMGLDASGVGLTLEAFVQCEGTPVSIGWPISVSAGNAGLNWAGIGAIAASNTWYASVQVNGSQRNTYSQTGTKVAIRYGVPTYLALTFDGNQLSLYIDGILRVFEPAPLVNPPWDRVLLGNAAVAPQPEVYSFQGAIMQARVSNVARSAAYILNNAETLFRM